MLYLSVLSMLSVYPAMLVVLSHFLCIWVHNLLPRVHVQYILSIFYDFFLLALYYIFRKGFSFLFYLLSIIHNYYNFLNELYGRNPNQKHILKLLQKMFLLLFVLKSVLYVYRLFISYLFIALFNSVVKSS